MSDVGSRVIHIHSKTKEMLEPHTRFFFYKNTLYKNIEAEIGWNFKNILRICPASPTYTQNHFFLFHLYIFFTWWIHRSVELFARSQNHFSAFNEYIAVLFNCNTEIGWEIKNILRIYKAGLAGNVKNTEPRPKFPYSYKTKSVYWRIKSFLVGEK